MNINADFDRRALSHFQEAVFVPSPTMGVERRMLDRVGGEVARATSVVRYARDSKFDRHRHGAGEEFIVLDGVFSDEWGDYPAGTYVRNPPGSGHAPWSEKGCTLFVKLRQFDAKDTERSVIDTRSAAWSPGLVEGLSVLPLHTFGPEHVALVRFAPGTVFQPHTHFGGEEVFVLDGVFEDEHGAYPAGTWLRNPHLSRHSPFSRQGCLIYVKVGHLQST